MGFCFTSTVLSTGCTLTSFILTSYYNFCCDINILCQECTTLTPKKYFNLPDSLTSISYNNLSFKFFIPSKSLSIMIILST
ncbi:hypothetical protein KFK09_005106 [Dendrobium nobile]|uniref:Uncharacterized protein n=1 Tax=Dendrobium nobile TaxID=94219 RepID=A0A8T3BXI8_DENNO|nr:hypothetical protein KFK09_005106 [Dendrobium nobile]